jgi:hypothetical protein
MGSSLKFVVKTDKGKTYILHIMDAAEFKVNQYVGLFLYHDEEYAPNRVGLPLMRHRLLFENSVNAIKDKVTEYTSGRNETIVFIESYPPIAA